MAIPTIHPFPFMDDLRHYRLSSLRADLIAALTIAFLALPQAMAYSFAAGLPPSAGIWSAVFGTLIVSAFGHSRFLITGPTNGVAILLQSGTSEILFTYYRGVSGLDREILALNIILLITFIIGMFQVIASFLRLGRLTQFTSHSVIVGFMAGAALTILVTQLFPFFGVPSSGGYQPLYQQVLYFFRNANSIHLSTMFLSIGCLFSISIFYMISKKIPGAAITFILAALIVYLFKLGGPEKIKQLQDLGPVDTDLPYFTIPFFEWRILSKVIPLAFAITILSVLKTTAIGKTFVKAKEAPYDDNQEIFGLGMGNLVCGFVGAMPTSGSLARTSLNFACKAKTRFSGIYSGLMVFGFASAFGFVIGKIPIAALSGLMFFIAFNMVNFRRLMVCLRATRSDAAVVIATFLSSIFFTLDIVLYVGVVLSIVLYLRQAATPMLIEYSFNNIGKLRPLDPDDERPDPRICIIQAEGELFFGAADLLQNKLRAISEDENIKIVILQLLNTRNIDASICFSLEQITRYLKATDRQLILSGVTDEVWEILNNSGVMYLIGEENCFRVNEQLPSEPTRNAYSAAKDKL